MKRIETASIHFEWNARQPKRGYRRLNAARCWNNPFWYGEGGEPATEPSVIVRRSDYRRLLKLARSVDHE